MLECACICYVKWDVVIDDTAHSTGIVENIAGSDGVVVEDDVVEDTVGSSSIVENTAGSDGVVVEDDAVEDTVAVVVLLRIQLTVTVLWFGCCH